MADEVELIGAGALSSDLVRLAQPGGAFDDATRAAADQLLAPAAANTRTRDPAGVGRDGRERERRGRGVRRGAVRG